MKKNRMIYAVVDGPIMIENGEQAESTCYGWASTLELAQSLALKIIKEDDDHSDVYIVEAVAVAKWPEHPGPVFEDIK